MPFDKAFEAAGGWQGGVTNTMRGQQFRVSCAFRIDRSPSALSLFIACYWTLGLVRPLCVGKATFATATGERPLSAAPQRAHDFLLFGQRHLHLPLPAPAEQGQIDAMKSRAVCTDRVIAAGCPIICLSLHATEGTFSRGFPREDARRLSGARALSVSVVICLAVRTAHLVAIGKREWSKNAEGDIGPTTGNLAPDALDEHDSEEHYDVPQDGWDLIDAISLFRSNVPQRLRPIRNGGGAVRVAGSQKLQGRNESGD